MTLDSNEGPTEIHFRVEHQGNTRWIVGQSRSVETGSARESVFAFTDVTLQQLFNIRIQEQDRRFRTIFENTPVALIIYDVDSLTPKLFNSTACAQSGYSESEFQSLLATDLYPGVSPELIFELRQRSQSSAVQMQGELRRKDGTVLTVAASWALLGREVFCSVMDLSERQAMEQERDRALLRAEMLADASTHFWIHAEDPKRAMASMLSRIQGGSEDIFTVRLLSRDGLELEPTMTAWAPEADLPHVRERFGRALPMSDPHIQQVVVSSGKPILIAKVSGDEPFFSSLQKTTMRAVGTFSLLAVPMQVESRTLGVLMVSRQKQTLGPLDQMDLSFYQELANRAALAYHTLSLRRALELELGRSEQLHKEKEQSLTELLRATAQLGSAREEERQWMARELHDELGHRLIAAKMLLERSSTAITEATVSKWIQDAEAEVEASIREVRDIASQLRPPILDALPLPEAVDSLLADVNRRYGIGYQTQIKIAELSDSACVGIYRVIQESITNVIKHAEASKIEVAVEGLGDKAAIVVEDDGVGISDGIGSKSLRARCTLLGGQMEVGKGEMGGTRIRIVLPLR